MGYLQNLHTHSTYCDGKDTPEEMIRVAMEKGFDSIGFSGHSYMFYSPSYSMSEDHTDAYKQEIRRLNEKYKGQIAVYLGLEADMYSNVSLEGYDYLIGSFHYLKMADAYVGFDRSADVVEGIIRDYFHEDGNAFAEEYFRQYALLPSYGKFDILGHFDLITKNLERSNLYGMKEKTYLSFAVECAQTLARHIPFFEINTGAIARGYRTAPYPSLTLLKEMKRFGYGAVISSDCHDARMLDCAFDQAHALLREAGFSEHFVLKENGFDAVALQE